MSCPNKYQKSSVRAHNSTEQIFNTPGNIVFSTVDYTSGTSISLKANDSNIYLKSSGLYFITADVIMGNSTANTDTAVQLYKNGVSVAGALAEETIVAAGDFKSGSISAIIPVSCVCPCGDGVALTFGVTGTTAAIEGVNVNVFKLA